MATGDQMSSGDTAYLSQLVAQRTGLTREPAQARVATTYTRLRQKNTGMDTAAKNAADDRFGYLSGFVAKSICETIPPDKVANMRS